MLFFGRAETEWKKYGFDQSFIVFLNQAFETKDGGTHSGARIEKYHKLAEFILILPCYMNMTQKAFPERQFEFQFDIMSNMWYKK